MKKIKYIFSLACVLTIVGLIFAKSPADDLALTRNLNTFNSVVKELSLAYVDSLKPDEAFREAIDAFLATVDPYTEFYTADDQESLKRMTTGEYGGIGSYIMERDGSTYFSGPMEGSPAAAVGIRAGDRVLCVDSIDTSKMSSDKVTKLLRGVPGTTLNVTVQRPFATDSVITFPITRAILSQPSVAYAGVLPDSIGYIHLTSFIDKSPAEVREALLDFKNHPELKGIVLDLRGNGGGLLESAVDILGYFLPKGTEVLRTRGRDAASERIYKTSHSPLYPDIPLVVVTDGSTASASEILAGAIQDLDRGVLIGSRSFGKGLVQTTRPLPYDQILKVTIAKYYIPSGRLIQALDYVHRNDDGSAQRLPDSLTREFRTLHGRIVRDGGGLQPDSVVTYPKTTRLVYNAVRDNWVFDFATKYAAEHPDFPPIGQFQISDSLYADFKRSIDPDRFKYDRVMEDALKQLREIADSEGYVNDETTAAFDTLSTLLTHNLSRDLDTNRALVESYLAPEIASRYYFDRGRIRQSLDYDAAIDVANAILSDPAVYNKFLAPVK